MIHSWPLLKAVQVLVSVLKRHMRQRHTSSGGRVLDPRALRTFRQRTVVRLISGVGEKWWQWICCDSIE